ncbi:MAG TPA: hypothetical protein VNR39_00605 [Pseudolabrys sp.]|nr:hypothetical protein [Pseudolabrys sp.]
MIRLALVLILAATTSGCATGGFKETYRVPVAKVTEVKLNDQQLTKLKEIAPRAEIAWLRAGRKDDGTIFVCHVLAANNIFGQRKINVITGTFQTDGTYEQSGMRYVSMRAVLDECRGYGFDPPVTVRTTYSTMIIR